MKGKSEGQVRAALNQMDWDVLVYKPPDDARNWKPADFMVWWDNNELRGAHRIPRSAMLEVKESPGKFTFPIRELRPSQLLGMRMAASVGLTYFLVIWWPKLSMWTISNAWQVANWIGDHPDATSLDYGWLNSVAGMDCTTRDLAPILRSALLGEVS
jgi:hypothetical protein